MSLSGQTIGPYRIGRLLGGGGMGMVYLAEDDRLGREVAIKFLAPAWAGHEEVKARFVQEARAASRLDHPNVCTIHDIGEDDDGVVYIVMERVDGETLDQRLRGGAMDAESARQVAIQVASGLALAHARGVVHRDIKPANLMIDRHGLVRILDFGLAKLVDSPLSRIGTRMGTLAYGAPEQARGDEVDARADVWSLGVVLFEMLTGRRLFPADQEAALLRRILDFDDADRRRAARETPGELAELVGACLAPSPEERPADAGAVLERLGGRMPSLAGAGSEATMPLSARTPAWSVPSAPASDGRPSVGVLPFLDLSPGRDQDPLATGLAEGVINALAGGEEVRVASRTAAFQFREAGGDVVSIARRLGVATVLEGSLRTADRRLRVNVQLVDAASGSPVFSQRWERRLDDSFELQDELAHEIAAGVAARLLSGAADRARPAPDAPTLVTPEPAAGPASRRAAEQLLLEGRHQAGKGTSAGIRRGLARLREALDHDPGLAAAHAAVAGALADLALGGFEAPRQALRQADAAARRARELDDRSAAAHAALARVAAVTAGRRDEAEAGVARALSLDPGLAAAHRVHGALLLLPRERHREARRALAWARELDPLSPAVLVDLARAEHFAGRDDAARDHLESALGLDDAHSPALLLAGRLERLAGAHDEATSRLERAREIDPGSAEIVAELAAAAAAGGRREEAHRLLEELEESRDGWISPLARCRARLALGERWSALRELELAAEAGVPELVWLAVDPEWRPLADEPRLGDLVAGLGVGGGRETPAAARARRSRPSPPDDLAALVPPAVHRALTTGQPSDGWNERRAVTAVVVELAGLTALADPEGRSRAAAGGALHHPYDRLLEIVAEHGGEPLRLDGRSALAVWPASGRDAAAAARAALALAAGLDGLEPLPGRSIRASVAIGEGELELRLAGGEPAGRRFLLVAGPALADLEPLRGRAGPGQVVASDAVAERIGPAGYWREGVGGSRELLAVVPAAARPAVAPPAAPDRELRAFVPDRLRERLAAGEPVAGAERLPGTVVVARVTPSAGSFDGTARRDAVRSVQAEVRAAGGELVDVRAAGSGLALTALWEEGADGGPAAALRLIRHLRRRALRCQAGVAAGEVLRAVFGGEGLFAPGIAGEVVDRAAGLMRRAEGGVLIDADARSSGSERLLLEELPPRVFGSEVEPVAIFRVLGERPPDEEGPALIGREEERSRLDAALDRLVESGRGGAVYLEGEPGIGKTRLLAEMLSRLESEPVRWALAQGDSLERSSAYHPFRAVYEKLVWKPLLAPADDPLATLEELLGEVGRGRASLASPVLPRRLREEEAVRQMTAEGRAEATRAILVQLLAASSGGRPTVVVLEDGHAVDSASWELAVALVREIGDLLLVVSSRPVAEARQPPAARRFLELDGLERLRLGALDPDDALALACRVLGASCLPPAVAGLLRRRAEGHPFFTEELARALLDREMVRVEAETCRLASWDGSADGVDLPATVQDVVRDRISSLDPGLRRTLEVASVVGRTFELDLLARVHPDAPSRRELDLQVAALSELALLDSGPVAPRRGLAFKHALIRDGSYETLEAGDRRRLHAAVAEAMEDDATSEPKELYPLLADHWRRAGRGGKALEYLDRAGDLALRAHATLEAAAFFRRALEICGEGGAGGPAAVRARWHRRLGETLYRMYRYPEAASELERALALLGRRPPESRLGWSRLLVGQSLLQAAALLRPGVLEGSSEEARRRAAEASLAASALAVISITRNDAPAVMGYSLLAANQAERAGTVAVRALGVLALAAASMKLRGLARRYLDRGKRAGQELDDLEPLVDLISYDAGLRLGFGEVERADATIREGLALAEAIGHRLGMAAMDSLGGCVAACRGDYRRQLESNRRARRRIAGLPARELEPWLQCGILDATQQLAPPAEAHASIADGLARARKAFGPGQKLGQAFLDALEARAAFDAGRRREALELATRTLETARRNLRAVPSVLFRLFEATADVFLAEAERQAADSGASRTVVTAARRAVVSHRRWVGLYPFRRCRLLLYEGRLAGVEGDGPAAAGKLAEALAEARRIGFPVVAAAAHRALASVAGGEEERRRHRAEARRLYLELGLAERAAELDGRGGTFPQPGPRPDPRPGPRPGS